MKTLHVLYVLFMLAIAVLLFVDALPYVPSKLTIPLKKKSITRRRARKLDRRVVENVEVSPQTPDLAYFGELTFGKSKTGDIQLFDIQFDTGSADLFVISVECKSLACLDKLQYDSKLDDDFVDLNKGFHVEYDRGKASGISGKTIIQIGDLSVNQEFGLVNILSDDFQSDKYEGIEGIMGMALNAVSENNQITLISNLLNDESRGFDAKQFSFKLGRDADGTESELTIGGNDPKRYIGQLTWSDLSENNRGHWMIPLDDCLVNGQPLNFAGRNGNLDTGTTLMVVPSADAQQIYANIGHEEKNGHFYISCDTKVTISLRIKGATWNIDPRDFVIEDNDECYGAIDGDDTGSATEWILGDTFLKNVYSVFDLGKLQVGLGQLA